MGSLVLLGKHQFKVSSVEPVHGRGGSIPSRRTDSRSDKKAVGTVSEDKRHSKQEEEEEEEEDDSHVSKSSSLEAIVGDAEELLLALEALNIHSSGGDEARNQAALIQARMQRLRDAATALSEAPSSPLSKEHKNDDHNRGYKEEDEEEDEVDDAVDMRLRLICFAPEGSPLIGVTYTVGREGATLGRGKNNGISLMLEDRSIDNSVSQEHARIEMDKVCCFECNSSS